MNRTLSKYISEYAMGDGTVGLFNSVFLTKKFIKKPIWRKVKEAKDFDGIPPAEVENLEDGKMIIQEGEDDKKVKELRSGKSMRPSVKVMYLFLTNACNMSCRYCVIDKRYAQVKTGSVMTRETANAAINFFLANAGTANPAILLWGGEPLSNWEVFKYAVERARALEKKYCKELEISTVTNGTLLTREIADFFKTNRVACSISMDGLKSQHDRMRVYADGRGTYGDILNNVRSLTAAGVEFGVSLAIGSHNVNLLPAVGRGLCKKLGTDRIGTCLLMNVGADNPSYTGDKKAARQLIKLFKALCEDNIFEDTMMKKVKSFALSIEHLHDCAAGGRQIAVMPNGSIGVCHYAATVGKWIIGNVKDPAESVFGSRELADWAARSPVNMPQCYKCPGLTMCGGGCPYEAYQKMGDVWALDERFCTHCSESIRWMMEELYLARGSTGAEGSAVLLKMKDVMAHSKFIRMFMPPLRASTSVALSRRELQCGADIFRRDNGLTSASATKKWMSRHGITPGFFEEFLESNRLVNTYRNYLKSHGL